MIKLVEFLNGDNEPLLPFELNENELKIVRFMLSNLLNANASQNVALALKTLFCDPISENFDYLLNLSEIFDLIDKEILKFNLPSNFKGELSEAVFLNCDMSLHENFLDFMCENSDNIEQILDKTFDEIGAYLQNDLVPKDDMPYQNMREYLDELFGLIKLQIKQKMMLISSNAEAIKPHIENAKTMIQNRLKASKFDNELENIFKEFELENSEQFLFNILLYAKIAPQTTLNLENIDVLAMLLGRQINKNLRNIYFDELTTLNKKGLIEIADNFGIIEDGSEIFFGQNEIFASLNGEILDRIISSFSPSTQKECKSSKIMFENSIKDSEIFELLSPKDGIDDVILSPRIREIFDRILARLDKKVSNKLKNWGIKDPENIGKKMIFYGPPGTGKTLSALSIAKSLKKEIISFDCSKILSKWVGESEQNVRKVFDQYKEICKKFKSEPILLLNEADQFLSTRIAQSGTSADKMHNQMQNIFLEQIEKFDGILIATTNFVEVFDTAFSRRFDYKIEFKKPNFEERVALWEKFLPKNAKFEPNFDVKMLAKDELTGAGIELVVKNTAFKLAVNGDEIFTMDEFLKEIKAEISGNFDREKIIGLL